MNEMRRNILVGLFVLGGLAAMGVLIVLFGQDSTWGMSRQAYELNIRFEQATGIRSGTLVTVGGIGVGRVREARFVNPERVDQGVNVSVVFDAQYRDVRLHAGTRAATIEPGMGMGRPPIELIPGPAEGPILESGAVITGRMSSAVETLIPPTIVATFDKTATQLGEAAAALTPVLRDMHEMLQPREAAAVDRQDGPPGNLSSAMARFDTALRNINTVIGDSNTQNHLKGSVDNIYAMTEDGKQLATDLKAAAADAKQVVAEMKTLMTKGQQTLDSVSANTDKVARALITNLDSMSSMLTELNAIAQAANRGEGSLGKFVRDDRLYESMVLTFRRLSETAEEMKALVKDWQQGKIRVSF